MFVFYTSKFNIIFCSIFLTDINKFFKPLRVGVNSFTSSANDKTPINLFPI